MSRTACAAILGILIPLISPSARALDPPRVPGEVLAAFKPTVSEEQARWVSRSLGGEVVEWLPARRLARVRLTGDPAAVDAAVVAFAADPSCHYAEPNYLGRGGEVIPDDTAFGDQWHLVNTGQTGGLTDADIDAETGWSISRGSASVLVAVLDTGVNTSHIEFAGRVLDGFDFVNGDPIAEDDHGHGSMVTGILAANADNGFAVAGVDHLCTLLPVKILDEDNFGSAFNLVQGLDYAVGEGADVINLSLIDYPGSLAIRNALLDAAEAGAVLVACGGNGGFGDADVSWPGASEYTIAVGWTNDQDLRDPDSGTGGALDLVAPGSGVITVRWDSDEDLTTSFSGCSAATPVVTGIVSLTLAVNSELTSTSLRALLIAGAEDEVGAAGEDLPGWDPFYGYGRVNLEETLTLANPSLGVDPGATPEVAARTRAVPNPFRTHTRLLVPGAVNGPVDVCIVGPDGREVRHLDDLVSGHGLDVIWDGHTSAGYPAPPGSYYWTATGTGGELGGGSIILLP
jgi:subtilisin family serine protease